MFRAYFWGWYTCYIACVCFVYQNTSRIGRRQIASKRSNSYIRSLLSIASHAWSRMILNLSIASHARSRTILSLKAPPHMLGLE